MPLKIILLLMPILFAITACQDAQQENWQERPDFGQYFEAEGVEGTFVLYDLQDNRYLVYNPQRANTGFIPASTFKIFNSLVALETEQIKDETEIIEWDGVEWEYPAWNEDHTLRTAIKHSVVWYYQILARGIGPERMQYYVDLAEYGNQDISGEIDSFWLEGGLRISPVEQVDFLRRLHHNDLPFSQRSIDIVKDILIYETDDNYILRAKKGWGQRFEPQIGWFVGYLEQNDNVYFFATNIDIVSDEDTLARVSISRQILQELGLL